jgi:hypothetical protein
VSDKPQWRRAYEAVDAVIAPRLEALLQGSAFAGMVTHNARVSHALRTWSEQQTRRVWHLWNLPSGSDVRRLRRDVSALDRQVRRLGHTLDDIRRTLDAAATASPHGD